MFFDWEFKFKDLGPVRDATLKLGDLTIITGRNNTGKTYIVYTLYGFLRDFSELANEVMEGWSAEGRFSNKIIFPVETIAGELLNSGRFQLICSEKDIVEDRIQLIRQMCKQYSGNKVDNVFNAHAETFARSVFDAEIDQEVSDDDFAGLIIETQLGGDLTIYLDEDKLVFLFEREEIANTETKADEFVQSLLLESSLRRVYAHFLFQDTHSFFSAPDCSTSVRQAISLFYPELETSRRLTVRRWLQRGKRIEDEDENLQLPSNILRNSTSRYALPIEDEISFVKGIPNFSSEWVTSMKGQAVEDLEKIIGGSFTKSDGILYFIPSKGNPDQTGIPLHLASSSAVEMSRLFFHFVLRREGGSPLLIIDEPESHLDTMNQIRFARALVRWVNSGMKILISTHSDFIVKEINNLIMLNGSFDEKEKLMEELGYEEGDSIDPSKIKAYYAVDGGLTECSKNAFGIEVRSFEDSIDELIRVSGVLGSRIILKDDEDE